MAAAFEIALPYLFSSTDVHEALTPDACIEAMRQAMIAHASGETRHLLRSFIGLGEGRTFAIMPGALAVDGYFGAKLVSVFADPDAPGRRAHRGVVALFDGKTGALAALADAEAITHARTAAASAAATDALALPGATTLAILGAGRQAEAHIRALSRVRPLRETLIWGRTPARVGELIEKLSRDMPGLTFIAAATPRETVERAEIVCTVTAAREPILEGDWLRAGQHVNLVGSSGPGPREADNAVVARARFFADCREHVSRHGAEYVRAFEEGAIGAGHILAEIGAVMAGTAEGRTSPADITVYKSLGHVVQDLAATRLLYESRRAGGDQV